MAGHSKWAQIKHKKAILDQKKGQLFSKLANEITVAVRQGGPDVEGNFKLKAAIEKAKSLGMPQENIERAIKRASGIIEHENLEEVFYEIYGPEGVAILVKAITENRNRTTSEIKGILNKFGGKLAEGGAVKWLFEEQGIIRFEKNVFNEKLEEKLIDLGAKDIKIDDSVEVYFDLEDFKNFKKFLEENKEIKNEIEISWVPKEIITISDEGKEKLKKLLEALDNQNEVEDIYFNTLL